MDFGDEPIGVARARFKRNQSLSESAIAAATSSSYADNFRAKVARGGATGHCRLEQRRNAIKGPIRFAQRRGASTTLELDVKLLDLPPPREKRRSMLERAIGSQRRLERSQTASDGLIPDRRGVKARALRRAFTSRRGMA